MKLLLCSITLCMAFIMQPAQVTFASDCDTILNAAQQSFADIFPGHPSRRLSKNRDPTTEKSLLAIFPEHFR